MLAIALVAGIAAPLTARRVGPHSGAPLSPQDAVVVADFTNATGETVFDDTLTQVLSMDLAQSPFLNVMSQTKARARMRMMGLTGTERLNPDIARELCVRSGAKAMLDGSIHSVGSHYSVVVNAVACASGDTLVAEHGEADRREDVLRVLSGTADRVRAGLGESLSSIQQFDAPADATTTSLDALRSFTNGVRVLTAQGDAPSIAFFKRALELDPNFALAHAAIASRYSNLGEPSLALQYASKAYELRDRVTEPERLLISARYLRLTGELNKLTQLLELWKSEYPRDERPYGSLGVNYFYMGEYAKALSEWQQSTGLSPTDVMDYENLADSYLALNRLDDAHATLHAAEAHRLDGGGLRRMRYWLAFLERDTVQMEQQVEWAVGRPGSEDLLLSTQSDAEAYFGRLANARRVSQRAVDSAIRADLRETAALWLANAALREAELGEHRQAIADIKSAMALDPGRNMRLFAALTFARVGDTHSAQGMAANLEREFPNNTVLQVYRIPSIKAAIALARRNPRQALEYLESAKPSELGQPTPTGLAPLYPVYLRGEAYLALHEGRAAAAEFQRILDHPGISLASALGPLAELGRARAAAMSEDEATARAAYRNVLLLWKDADPGLGPLNSAKAELSSLTHRAARRQPARTNSGAEYAALASRRHAEHLQSRRAPSRASISDRSSGLI